MKTILSMLVTLTVIGVISGAALSQIDNWARPLIAANKKADTERAIYLVQPYAKSYEPVTDVKFELYRVFDEAKQPLGYALPYEGSGFQGKIRLMVGVSQDINTIIGLEVLDQVETPGLGTKVTEDPFRSAFKNLSASPSIESVKGAPPTKPNQVQTITGATISSKAVIDIINAGLTELRQSIKAGGQS